MIVPTATRKRMRHLDHCDKAQALQANVSNVGARVFRAYVRHVQVQSLCFSMAHHSPCVCSASHWIDVGERCAPQYSLFWVPSIHLH
ncbi:mCG4203 [Mus musculus]|nr:mCG4203 [Mus musculus]